MPLQIIRGKRQGAIRAVFYGTEGIGKSTFASKIPDAVIIDTEDGTGQIDVARAIALDWRAIEHAIKELIADNQGFRAVIIDTADWLEKALIEFMLKQSGKKSIEDYGYGKGYTILQEHVVRFLSLVDQLIAKGIHVVFVAHAKTQRTSPPDQTDGFDRYELKLTKQVAPLLKEWADLVLFCNYRLQIVEGSDGRLKAQGGKDRVMHAEHSAAWDAKNRFGLPAEMPMDFAQIAHLFAGIAAPRSSTPAAKQAEAEAATNAAIEADPAETNQLATNEQVKQIEALRKSKHGAELVEEALSEINAIDTGELTVEQAAALIAKIEAADAPAGATFAPNVLAWLEANEAAANAYLAHIKWITGAQTWRDVSQDNADSITDRFAKFSKAVTGHASAGRKAA